MHEIPNTNLKMQTTVHRYNSKVHNRPEYLHQKIVYIQRLYNRSNGDIYVSEKS